MAKCPGHLLLSPVIVQRDYEHHPPLFCELKGASYKVDMHNKARINLSPLRGMHNIRLIKPVKWYLLGVLISSETLKVSVTWLEKAGIIQLFIFYFQLKGQHSKWNLLEGSCHPLYFPIVHIISWRVQDLFPS